MKWCALLQWAERHVLARSASSMHSPAPLAVAADTLRRRERVGYVMRHYRLLGRLAATRTETESVLLD